MSLLTAPSKTYLCHNVCKIISKNPFCLSYVREMINKIQAVQLKDMLLMTEKYLKPLFTQDFMCALVTPQDKVISIADQFKRYKNNDANALLNEYLICVL